MDFFLFQLAMDPIAITISLNKIVIQLYSSCTQISTTLVSTKLVIMAKTLMKRLVLQVTRIIL